MAGVKFWRNGLRDVGHKYLCLCKKYTPVIHNITGTLLGNLILPLNLLFLPP